jgi:hypothetical protein
MAHDSHLSVSDHVFSLKCWSALIAVLSCSNAQRGQRILVRHHAARFYVMILRRCDVRNFMCCCTSVIDLVIRDPRLIARMTPRLCPLEVRLVPPSLAANQSAANNYRGPVDTWPRVVAGAHIAMIPGALLPICAGRCA